MSAILDLSKVLFFAKLQQILLESLENMCLKEDLKQIFLKFYSFLFQTLICIINYA